MMSRKGSRLINWRPSLRLVGLLAEPGIRSLTGAMLPLETESPFEETVAAAVAEKVNAMPTFIAIPIAGLTVLFDWSAVLRFGRRSGSLAPAELHRLIEIWKSIPVGPLADTMFVYERLTPFVFFSHHSTVHDNG